MAKKKKKKSTKKKVKKGSTSSSGSKTGEVADESKKLEAQTERKEDDVFVLNVKLPNWKYLDFTMRVTPRTPLFVVTRKIRERYGPLKDLEIFKEAVTEDNAVPLGAGETNTLEEVGIRSKAPKQPSSSAVAAVNVSDTCASSSVSAVDAQATIFVDYKTVDSDNTILLVNTALPI